MCGSSRQQFTPDSPSQSASVSFFLSQTSCTFYIAHSADLNCLGLAINTQRIFILKESKTWSEHSQPSPQPWDALRKPFPLLYLSPRWVTFLLVELSWFSAQRLTDEQAYLLLALPLLTEDSPIPSILPTKIQVEIIPVLPLWALVSLGAYLLGRLGLGVLRFNDTVEAYEELTGQLDTARKNLDNRKVRWD